MKKILIGLGALATAATLGFAPNASAACSASSDDTSAETGADDDVTTVEQTGTKVYGDSPETDNDGYIGVTGSRGYIEANGDGNGETPQLDVEGRSSGGEVDGSAGTSGVCVNDVTAP